MRNSNRRYSFGLFIVASLVIPTGAADTEDAAAPPNLPQLQLDDLQITAPGADEGFLFDTIRPNTLITLEELQRRQAGSVFDVLQDVPGVSITGGPLDNGKTINIRGFQDTEDVLIKIDGAIKDFEKYRFGGGPFVDPELLKQVEVKRGASSQFEGSGALGGVVVMETKDARDFLYPGEKAGVRTKYGHNFNNDEDAFSITAFGAPTDSIDLLVDVTRRRSNDLTLADGSRMPNSAASKDSILGKVELYPTPDITLSIGHTTYKSESLEPPDASAGPADADTYVRRKVDDRTTTGNLRFDPVSPWIDTRIALNRVDTSVDDIGIDEGGLPPAGSSFHFIYDLMTFDINNTAMFSLGPVDNLLKVGVQVHRNERNTLQTIDGVTEERRAQPPGIKYYEALMLENVMTVGDLTLIGSIRRDDYRVSSLGSAKETLIAEGRETDISFTEYSPTVRVAYRPFGGPVSFSHSYARSFRPPLIDEYFGVLSATCSQGVLINDTPWEPSGIFDPIPPETPGFDSGLCGDLYESEEAVTRETAVSGELYDLVFAGDMLNFKIAYYTIDVSNVIETMTLISPTEVGQPGIEHRRGWETELGYTTDEGFVRFGYSESSGSLECPGWAAGNGEDLVLPADNYNWTIGLRGFDGALEYGYRGRMVLARDVIEEDFSPAGANPCKAPFPTEKQDGYTLHNLFLSWQPDKRTVFRASVDNLTNVDYELENGESAGSPAPGRSIRFSVAHSF